jgi:hypothetical protein
MTLDRGWCDEDTGGALGCGACAGLKTAMLGPEGRARRPAAWRGPTDGLAEREAVVTTSRTGRVLPDRDTGVRRGKEGRCRADISSNGAWAIPAARDRVGRAKGVGFEVMTCVDGGLGAIA